MEFLQGMGLPGRVRRVQQWHQGFRLGQGLPEYATILALIVVFCLASLMLFGNNISLFMVNMGNYLGSVSTG